MGKDKFLLVLKALVLCMTAIINFIPFLQYRPSKHLEEQFLRILIAWGCLAVYSHLEDFEPASIITWGVIFGVLAVMNLILSTWLASTLKSYRKGARLEPTLGMYTSYYILPGEVRESQLSAQKSTSLPRHQETEEEFESPIRMHTS